MNIMLLNQYFHFLTGYIVDGYVKKATRSLDLYSHGFRSLNTVSNKNKISFFLLRTEITCKSIQKSIKTAEKQTKKTPDSKHKHFLEVQTTLEVQKYFRSFSHIVAPIE